MIKKYLKKISDYLSRKQETPKEEAPRGDLEVTVETTIRKIPIVEAPKLIAEKEGGGITVKVYEQYIPKKAYHEGCVAVTNGGVTAIRRLPKLDL